MTRIILIWQVLDCSRGLHGNRRHRPGQRHLRDSSQALGVHACGSGHLLRQQKTLARAAAPNILSTGLTAEVSLRCAACAAHFRDVAQTCCMCMGTLMYHQYCGVVCRPFSVCSQSTRPAASSASSPPLVNKPPPPPGLSQRHPSRVLSIGLILRLLLRIMSILLLLPPPPQTPLSPPPPPLPPDERAFQRELSVSL